MDCDDVEVILKAGGTLQVTGGQLEDLNLKRDAGGNFVITGGTVTECGTFFIIQTPSGAAVISL